MQSPEPTWAPERHLDAVYRRGRHLRWRRRLVLTSAPLLVAGFVGVALARLPATSRPNVVNAAQGHGNDSTEGGPIGGGSDSDGAGSPRSGAHDPGSASTPGAPTGDGTAQSQGSGATPLAPAPASGSVGGTPGTPPPSGSPSTAAPAAKTGAAPNTAAPAAAIACSSSDLQYTTRTDRSHYGSGQSVSVTLVITNRASHPCDGPSPCGVGPWATVQNGAGTIVWQSHPLATMCTNPPPSVHLAPGQSASYGAGVWDQTICTSSGACTAAASGSYTATARRGDVTATAAHFRIN
ncbi:MAG: hypothetical protein JO086_09305 [Acidimicrobiia bacterium]|nr:hypothetical protein [Acidimicrobiia bacterium]